MRKEFHPSYVLILVQVFNLSPSWFLSEGPTQGVVLGITLSSSPTHFIQKSVQQMATGSGHLAIWCQWCRESMARPVKQPVFLPTVGCCSGWRTDASASRKSAAPLLRALPHFQFFWSMLWLGNIHKSQRISLNL